MTVTMADIAKDLNVSVVTVSKALRNQGRISEKTRQRVLERSRQLNYRPNLLARGLATRRSYTIGLLLPDYTHPFFAQIAKSVSQIVRTHGYHLLISSFDEDPELELSESQGLLARHVDGMIVTTSQDSRAKEMFEGLLKRNVPFILIDRPMKGVRATFVGADHKEIGELATQHLIEQGCRSIAHLRGPEIPIADDRCAGYRAALKENGFCVKPQLILEAGFQRESGYDAMRKLLASGVSIDGVFCFNDLIAIGAMMAILDAGLRIPQDIAVVGSGNIPNSDALLVPLTSVDQDASKIGYCAAENLLIQIEEKGTANFRNILLPCRLVVRASTQRRGQAQGSKKKQPR